MAKKHSDKELQNMSVEELQSLKNDLLPQKERPNYDTRTSGGRDDTGVCCDASLGCFLSCSENGCEDSCNDCCGDGDCPDSFTSCSDHGCEDSCNSCCPIIEYPSFTVVGGWDGSDQTVKNYWRIVAYPYADEFHDGTSFADILEGSMSEPIEDGSWLLTIAGSETIGWAYKNGGVWIDPIGDISSTVKGMSFQIASVGSDKILNWGT
tara:strand:+ start:802 stop:1425 length:624 start_codon:yes stop_codon:yes gene_type:complete